MARSKLARQRARDGVLNDLASELGEHMAGGQSFNDAVIDIFIERATERYQAKIAAMLRRGGLDIGDSEPINQELIFKLVSRGLGFEIDSLDEEQIIGAADAYIAQRLGAEIGIEISTVMNVEVLKSELFAAVIASAESGASKLIAPATMRRARAAATYARLGLTLADRKAVSNWQAQKRYRKYNTWTWD